MTRGRLRSRAALAMGALVFISALTSAADKSIVHTIVMDGTAFSPDTLTVKRGDTVVWVNKDPFPHTVTAVDGAFDSKSINAGKRWTYVARKPGSYAYGCAFHPNMKGTFKVE